MRFKIAFFLFVSAYCFSQDNNFPYDKVDSIIKRIELPVIPNFKTSVLNYGAKGDSVTNCKTAFEKAMKACEKRSGGTIIVPKGIYTINGPINFVSNVNLHLEEGAKIRFGSNSKDYPLVLTSWEGTMLYNYSPMIYGNNLENVAITGNGIIDGEAKEVGQNGKL